MSSKLIVILIGYYLRRDWRLVVVFLGLLTLCFLVQHS
jgi:hypothetical protein